MASALAADNHEREREDATMRPFLNSLRRTRPTSESSDSRIIRRHSGRRALRIEPLEQRCLLSASTGNDSPNIEALPEAASATNTAPSLWIRGMRSIANGAELSIADIGIFSDPDVGDTTFTGYIDWGDGSAVDVMPAEINITGTESQATWGTFDGAHTFTVAGRYEASFWLTDDQGGQSTVRYMTIDVTQSVPQDLVVEPVAEINEGDSAILRGTFEDTGSGKSHTVTVSWGDGTSDTELVLATGVRSFELTHNYEDDGPNPGGTNPASELYTYPISVTVTDNEDNTVGTQTSVDVQNAAPQLTVIGSQQFPEGYTFDGVLGTYTDSGVLDTHTAVINWGDGTTSAGIIDTAAGTISASHTYSDENRDASENEIPYTVTVTLTDDDTGTSSESFEMRITNVAPVLDAISDQEADEGQTISFGPTLFTDVGVLDTHTATIDWGDGNTSSATVDQNAGTVAGSHTFADNGSYTVAVTLLDNGGGQSIQTFQVDVANVSPTLTVASNQAASSGSTLQITNVGVFTDPGYDNANATPPTVESFTYQVNWGDGTAVDTGTATIDVSGGPGVLTQGSFDGSHVYTMPGEYTVAVTVTDDDGGQDTGTFLVNVNEVAPVLTINVPTDLDYDEGETFTWSDLATFTHTSSNSAQQYTYTIDWGDGSTSTGQVTDITSSAGQNQGSFGGSHTYADNGNYTVSVTVEVVGATATDQDSFDVVIKNVSPSLSGVQNYSTTVGSQLVIDPIRVSDPGYDNPLDSPATVETFTYRISWGDGTETDTGDVTIDVSGSAGVLTQGYFSGSHTYQAASTGQGYEATVTAIDDDSGATATIFVVNVTVAAAPQASALIAMAAAAPSVESTSVATQNTLIGPLPKAEYQVSVPSVTVEAASSAESTSVATQNTLIGPLPKAEYQARASSIVSPVLAEADSDNEPPVLGTVGNLTLSEGQLDIVDIGTFIDFDSAGPFNYTIDWGDDAASDTGTASITISGPPTTGSFDGSRLMDDAVYTIALSLSDEQGNSVTESVFFTIENVPPTADPGGPYEVDENGSIQLEGEGTDPAGDLDPLTFEWDLDNDGIYGETGADAERGDENVQNPVFSAAGLQGPQTWPVRLRVLDDDGGVSSIETTSVEIRNVPPAIENLQIATPVSEGNTSTLSGSLVDPSEGDTLALQIDWGDGSPVETYSDLTPGESFSYDHVYEDDGLTPGGSPSHDYDVSVVISDDAGGSNSYPLTVRVNNVSPLTVTLEDLDRVDENEEVTLQGSFADPGVLDTHVVTIDWGDGDQDTIDLAVGELQFQATHRYLDDGPSPGGTVPSSAVFYYSIQVTVEDDDTGTGTAAVTATVDNVAPTLTELATVAIDENEITTLSGRIVDPGTLDAFVLQLDWNDQTTIQSIPFGDDPIDTEGITWDPETRQFTVKHQYLDDGFTPGGSPFFDYEVDLTVTDDDTGSTSSAASVRVTNVDPTTTITSLPTETPLEGSPITLSSRVTDPGTLDTFTYAWSVTRGGLPYDDGNDDPTNRSSFTFLPDDDGEYRVSLIVTDDDTGTYEASVDIAVENAPPVAVDDHYQFDGIGVFEVAASGILANDYDAGQDYPLQAVDFTDLIGTGSGSDYGVLAAYEDGSFTYEAPEGYSGTVAFTYVALDQDGARSESPAVVSIDVGMNSTISGYVYAENQDSQFTPDQLPLPGVFVTLEAIDDNGIVRINALTDDDGYYEFTSLRAGTYLITERQPAAILDGGQHEQTVTIAVNEDSANNNFAECWLRPQQISIGIFTASNLSVPPDDYFWPTDVRERMAQAEEDAGNDYEAAVIRQGDMVYAAQRGSILSLTGTDLNERFVIESDTDSQVVTVYSNGFERTYEAAVDEVFTLTINGGGGSDVAVLYDSTRSDLLEGRYNLARLINDRFLTDLLDFDRVRAISQSGGNDQTSVESTIDYLLTLEGPWDDN